MNASQFATWEAAVRWLLEQPDRSEIVRACYYDRPALGAAQRFWLDPEWRALREFIPASKGTALDVGAGMGIASFALAKDGWHTTALEPDPSALVGAAAIRSLAREGGVNIEVVEQWGERLPFADGAFDLVHARQVLHHARDLSTFCVELFRVLRSGGVLTATREHVISSSRQLPAFLERHELHRYYGGENAYMLRTYLSALRGAGFEVRHCLGPFQSVINFAPFTEDSLCEEIANRAAKVPGGRWAVSALLARGPLRRIALDLLSRIDRRPGRLFTFVCVKP